MEPAALLAALRHTAGTDEHYRDCLSALASSLPRHDAIADIITRAADEIDEYIDGQRAVAEMRADDLDNQRLQYQDRGEFDAQSGAIPTWMTAAGAGA